MTHINAYFEDVDKARQEVDVANSKLEEAKRRLEVKKSEVGFEDKTDKEKSTASKHTSKTKNNTTASSKK